MKHFRAEILLLIIALMICRVTAQTAGESQDSKTGDYVLTGFVEENITIPVGNFDEAVVKIDNKQVVIDGYWEFKDSAGEVLAKPKILSQPADLKTQLVLALRETGTSRVSVTEGGKTKYYQIAVKSRFKENQIEKELETAILTFVADPGLRVTVLPPQSSLVGANLRRAFGDETASEIVAPRGDAVGSGTGQITRTQDFRPVIVLEGEVKNDLKAMKAINVSLAYTDNVINLMSIRNIVQVQIKVNVLSVETTKDSVIGVQYRSSASADRFALPFGVNSLFTGGAPFFSVLNANVDASGAHINDFQAQLNASIQRGTTKVLQSPTMTVMNGQPAEFLAGTIISVPTSVTVNNGTATQQFSERTVGVTLRISPISREETTFRPRTDGTIPFSTISVQERRTTRSETPDATDMGVREQVVNSIDENGVVRLLIQPSVSSLGTTAVNGIRPVNTNQMETRVAIRNGDTLVIGGLFTNEDLKNLESIPFIEKIPILGELFKNRDNSKTRRELMFTLTPYIIGLDDFDKVNDRTITSPEMRREMNSVGIGAKPVRISATEVMVREPIATAAPAQPADFKDVGVRPVEGGALVTAPESGVASDPDPIPVEKKKSKILPRLSTQ